MNKKPNKYIKPMSEEEKKFWSSTAHWFKDRNQKHWYDRIDYAALAQDVGETQDDVLDLVDKLVAHARLRDQVIEHRRSVANHAAYLIDFILRRKFTADQMSAQLLLVAAYLEQMQVVSGLQPDAPNEPHRNLDDDLSE